MKTVAVLQPGYLPWLGFFDQMLRADVFIIYDDVQFDKHSWRNRNRIKSSQGPHWLTVPVRVSGLDKPANNQIRIDPNLPWSRKHIGTIRQFYSRAHYIAAYLPSLEKLLSQNWDRLVDLNQALLELLCSWLDIRYQPILSSSLHLEGERSERLLRICQHFGATHYLSGNAAQSYLDSAIFEKAAIEIVWQNYRHPVYPQLHGEFVSHLSVLDLLMNCGEESKVILRQSSESL
jgi:hypothetical protein